MLALAVDEVVGCLRDMDAIRHSARAVRARPILCRISKRASINYRRCAYTLSPGSMFLDLPGQFWYLLPSAIASSGIEKV